MNILVTGATGVLGRSVLNELRSRDIQAQGFGRSDQADLQGDLLNRDSLGGTIQGFNVVVHCATALAAHEDKQMTANLIHALQAEQDAGRLQNLVYVSISGVDQVTAFPYYSAKLHSERLIEGSGLPHTILRATQFFDLADYLLKQLRFGSLQLASPHLRMQPVAPQAVGVRLADLALLPAAGRVLDIAGPERLSLSDMARIAARSSRRRYLLHLPLPIPALRKGRLIPARCESVGCTYREWLAAHGTGPSHYSRKYPLRRV
ncbi:SDR family oxidoreductase [Deinococcus radiophilus]|uniref:NAD-dependent epimerase/dehydratase family protein n=1 Tax=Deinococcus radiophilus TaxID=32062 RepID=A0A3S0I2X8_9DEIO|nr:NAD(P)H-binding protein [Deinococcus radiophilus]RTR22594.1 NAD-dependent epimerase/dehydratase family protein [Deinococcus radiophilus]UFA51620.1 NAD(P)H-binding protein [Deinococcus radiophilus]